MIKMGCCGFPIGRRAYGRRFEVVEVQQTFYQPPPPERLRRVGDDLPPPFEFTVNAWQVIPHPVHSPTYRRGHITVPAGREGCYGFFRPTEEVHQGWQRTREAGQALGARVVLFQTPPSFSDEPTSWENLRNFFESIERGHLAFVWEPRGHWREDSIRGLCRELDLVHGVDPLEQPPLWGDFHYFRLHGGRGYRHVYTDEELERLWALCGEGGETYCLFNNRSMLSDAQRFLALRSGG